MGENAANNNYTSSRPENLLVKYPSFEKYIDNQNEPEKFPYIKITYKLNNARLINEVLRECNEKSEHGGYIGGFFESL